MKIHRNHLEVNSNIAGKTQISFNQVYIDAYIAYLFLILQRKEQKSLTDLFMLLTN